MRTLRAVVVARRSPTADCGIGFTVAAALIGTIVDSVVIDRPADPIGRRTRSAGSRRSTSRPSRTSSRHWFLAAVVSWTFPAVAARSGAGAFGCFAAMTGLPLRFAWKPMPETRGGTLEDIEAGLARPTTRGGAMPSTTGPDRAATAILDALGDRRPAPRLVALVGIPGSGKSTVAGAVAARVPGAVVVPMDGYHLPRAALDAAGLARRGAPDTFDPAALRADLRRLRESGGGGFPAFDHAAQDPQPGAVVVPPEAPLVIVEGLYLLLRSWPVADLFDASVFLDCDLETALDRVAARHLACGLEATPAAARARADTNDRRNARTVLDDGGRARADLVIPADG